MNTDPCRQYGCNAERFGGWAYCQEHLERRIELVRASSSQETR